MNYFSFIYFFCFSLSVWGIEECLWQLVLQISIAYYTCKETSDVIRDEKQVANELALEIV